MADISAGGAARELPQFDPGAEARGEAAARFLARAEVRTGKIERLNAGEVCVDTPERVAKRADRLRRYHAGEALLGAPVAVPSPGSEAAGVDGRMLEQIINSADFVDIRFLEAGVAAARAVARVNVRNQSERVVGYGTASLISSRLALTNHHVLPSVEVARRSAIEFNYQDGIDGQPLQPRLFRLDPDRFYLADKANDFAIVAVAADEAELAAFGFNRLIDVEGKAVVGEFVTIVQHPRGEKKQVSLRENRVVDLLDAFIHYETDTEPGSSGSPVFNDQWEVVALHHASVAAPTHAELGSIMNEGIRVSALVRAARAGARQLPAAMARLFDSLFQDQRSSVGIQAPPPPPPEVPRTVVPGLQSFPVPEAATQETRITVPIEIIVRVGAASAPTTAAAAPPPPAPAPIPAPTPAPDRSAVVVALPAPAPGDRQEAIRIDPDYASRKGYDPGFLGPEVALPTLPPSLRAKAAVNRKPGSGPAHVLPYHHFSVVMNRERGLAFFTAVNIDGTQSRPLKREADRWSLDPRIAKAAQTGEAVYADNDLDRGHLVRRLDPAWGATVAAAKAANDDTFHFTNCTPQHKDFNQNRTTWAGLEDFVLQNADNHDLKVSVFTGPVLAADDDVYRGVKLPRQFWKVVVMARRDGTVSATGYLLSQEQLLHGLELAGEFSYGAYRTFQVPVARVATVTGLSFGTLAAADPLARLESTQLESEGDVVHEVGTAADLVL